jgi:hypothetical protein
MPLVHSVSDVENDHSKRKASFILFAALSVASSLLSIGCNTMPRSAAAASPANPCTSCVAMQISPTEPSVVPGEKVQFSATMSNTNKTAVTWSASEGTISSSGLFTAPANPSAKFISVTATSVAQSGAEARTVVTIHRNKFAITVSNLSPAVIAAPYSAALTASGGQPPYAWSIAAGSLPQGLQLDAGAGTLSGSPTKAGTFSFTVQGTDAASQTAQQPLSLVVSSPLQACGPPAYCSRTDVVVVPIPTKPPNTGNLSGANTVVVDPDFHNRIVRITDANTNSFSYFRNRTYTTAASGSADENIWNLDSTLFVVQDTGTWGYPFSFDPNTMQAARMYVSSSPQTGGFMLPSSGTWSRVNRNLLFTNTGTAIEKYDFTDRNTPPNAQAVYDFTSSPNCLPPGFAVTWRTRGGVSGDDTVFGMAYSNKSGQNTGVYAVAYKVGSGCTVLNTQTGQVWGDWGAKGTIKQSERWTIHNAKISKDGNWLVVVVGNCLTSNCQGPFFWQIGTTNVISCADSGRCDGHWTEGYTHWVNNNNSPISNQMIRSFADKNSAISLTHDFPSAFSGYFDQHQSWNNADPADSVPFLSSTWIPAGFTIAPWYDEIIAVAANGSGTTWRFAHSFITGRSQNFSTMYAIGSVSQDGKFFVFSSDWMGTLGSESGSKTCSIGTDCRGDVFVVELR